MNQQQIGPLRTGKSYCPEGQVHRRRHALYIATVLELHAVVGRGIIRDLPCTKELIKTGSDIAETYH
jgi:hypothetical protein